MAELKAACKLAGGYNNKSLTVVAFWELLGRIDQRELGMLLQVGACCLARSDLWLTKLSHI